MGIPGTLAVLALVAATIFFARFAARVRARKDLLAPRRIFGMLLLAMDALVFYFLWAPHDGSYYGRIGSEGYYAIESLRAFRTQHAQHAAALADVPKIAKGSGGIHVLVLGESQNKQYMHAYGYEKETTPWLDQMKTSDACIFFQHAYSNHTYTVPVLTYALTEKNQYNDLDESDALSILEVAKAAGYRTAWISNQGKNGISDTPMSILSHDADIVRFLNEHQYLDIGHVDEELVPVLDDVLQELGATSGDAADSSATDGTDGTDGSTTDGSATNGANGTNATNGTPDALIVVHLMGCHEHYNARYPKDYAGAAFDASTNEGKYENVTRYVDDVTRDLYEHAKKAAGFRDFTYFSDHGEAPASGNAHNPDLYEPCMTYIPFYILYSDAAKNQFPSIYSTLRANAAKPWTNDLAYELLITLLGLTPPHAIDPADNLASPDYDGSLDRLKTCHGEREITPENQ